MASTTETGHAKIVANFEELISVAVTLGTAYNPSKNSLKLTALQAQAAAARTAMVAVNTALSAQKSAYAARKTAFGTLSKYVTRIVNALKSSDSTAALDKSAIALAKKIHGTRTTAKLTEEEKKSLAETGEEVTENSASQMSFDNRLENFDKIYQLLVGIPQYSPNEADLKLTGIAAVYSDLKAKNAAAVTAFSKFTSARILRDDLLYKPLTGIVDTSVDVKMYVKSVFGAGSPQFRQVSKISFVGRRSS
jgi:hypothetical protein